MFIHPRLKKLVDSFVFTGTPFEAYLNATLKPQMISFIRKVRDKEKKENTKGTNMNGTIMWTFLESTKAKHKAIIRIPITDNI